MRSGDCHLHDRYQHPNEVNWHNQHAHGTGDCLGNAGFARSFESGDQEEE